jgi:molybdopterin-guanine dinucleotide biosynthesis protein
VHCLENNDKKRSQNMFGTEAIFSSIFDPWLVEQVDVEAIIAEAHPYHDFCVCESFTIAQLTLPRILFFKHQTPL